MGIWKPRWMSARATPGPAVSPEPAVSLGADAAEGDELDLDLDHDRLDAHEAAALGAEHTDAEHTQAWTHLHRG